MNGFFESNIGWILIVSGSLTAIAGVAAFLFPKTLLRMGFGISEPDGAIFFFVMHWGVLIFVVGALLYAVAYAPAPRAPVLVAAAIEKFAIVFLVFFGPLKRTPVMTFAAVFDGTLALIYTLYLTTIRG